MDPLCHTLAGATLAQAGLKRLTPLAASTLVIGANLPDLDAISNAWGGDVALCVRRGWSHGVLAMVVLPVALTALMLAVDRLRRWRDAGSAPARPLLLLGVSTIGVWSHPALDWLNTYGVRLLMPFSGRWFYGDAVFIIDPWLWLLLGAAAALATTHRPSSMSLWAVIGLTASWIMLSADEVPGPARVVWVAGVVAILLVRLRRPAEEGITRLARACLVAALAYVLAMVAGSAVARRQADAVLAAEGRAPQSLMAGPVPANPFDREIIAVHADRYTFHLVNLFTGRLHPFTPDVFINGPDAITEAALGAPSVRGLRAWLRFPSFEVERTGDGYRVTIRDVRYSRFGPRARGIGVATVDLDHDLRPR